jgi:hypothetical protein
LAHASATVQAALLSSLRRQARSDSDPDQRGGAMVCTRDAMEIGVAKRERRRSIRRASVSRHRAHRVHQRVFRAHSQETSSRTLFLSHASGMTPDVEKLLRATNDELAKWLGDGHAIDPTALEEREYCGISLGLPHLVETLTWKKFMKTFHRDPMTRALRGWNVRMVQSPLDDPSWEPTRDSRGEPRAFGHYEVRPLAGYEIPQRVPRGLMLDYGRGRNRSIDPVRRVRDPLVAMREGDATLLLGWSYVDLGLGQIGTPSYFVLMSPRPLSHRV